MDNKKENINRVGLALKVVGIVIMVLVFLNYMASTFIQPALSGTLVSVLDQFNFGFSVNLIALLILDMSKGLLIFGIGEIIIILGKMFFYDSEYDEYDVEEIEEIEENTDNN